MKSTTITETSKTNFQHEAKAGVAKVVYQLQGISWSSKTKFNIQIQSELKATSKQLVFNGHY